MTIINKPFCCMVCGHKEVGDILLSMKDGETLTLWNPKGSRIFKLEKIIKPKFKGERLDYIKKELCNKCDVDFDDETKCVNHGGRYCYNRLYMNEIENEFNK